MKVLIVLANVNSSASLPLCKPNVGRQQRDTPKIPPPPCANC